MTSRNWLLSAVGSAMMVVMAAPSLAEAQAITGGGRQRQVRLTVKATYDSNVARGGQPVADARELRKDDILYTPNIDVDISAPLARQTIFLSGSAGYEFYHYNDRLSRERIELTGGVAGNAGPCAASLTAGYSRRQSDQADLDIAVTENTQQTTLIGGQVSCPLVGNLGHQLSVQRANTTNNADAGVEDSESLSVTTGLTYGNRRLGSVDLSVGYSHVSYEAGAVTLRPPSPDYESLLVRLGYSRAIGARLTGNASLGYTKVFDNGGVDDYAGWSGSGSLAYRVNSRLTTNLSYARSVSPSIREGAGYEVNTSVQLDAGYSFSSRVRGNIGARWGERSYPNTGVSDPLAISSEETEAQFGSVIFDVGRRAKFAVEARREARNTNSTLFNYDAYRVAVSASTTF